jgi:hypothetical protein
MDLKHHLKRPYYYNRSTKNSLIQALGFGLFIFLFLLFFKPFQIDQAGIDIVILSAGFGLVTGLTMVILNVLIPSFTPGFFNEGKWNVGKEFLWTMINISSIGLINFIYYSIGIIHHFSWAALWWFQIITFIIGLFPLSFYILWKERHERVKFDENAQALNEQLNLHIPTKKPSIQDEVTIQIPSLNAGENLYLGLDQLYYIKASDNYLEIYYMNEKGMMRTIIRNTLKLIEEEVQPYPNLFRCHKSYLVNMEKVISISGNAQGFKLDLGIDSIAIPVSRQYNDSIRTRLPV